MGMSFGSGADALRSCPIMNAPHSIETLYIFTVLSLLACNTVFLILIMSVSLDSSSAIGFSKSNNIGLNLQ